MHSKSDAELLREYAQGNEDAPFEELLRRHVDLVHSAALRQSDSADAAAEISQTVFVDLARRARLLASRFQAEASLAGWLCRSARNQALNLRRNEFRRHARERLAMDQLVPTESSPDWERLRPILDAAMAELSEAEYDALVMRFFQKLDLRAVGRALGVSDNAAQKRIVRALDKLRELLSRRGLTTTTGVLSLAITANGVQAAPAGLTLTISAAASMAGTAAAAATATTITKTIAMTTLQKALITTAAVAAVGAGVYESRKASIWEARAQTSELQQTKNANQLEELERQRDEAVNAQAALRQENQRLAEAAAEVPRLRGELARARRQQPSSAAWNAGALDPNDPAVRNLMEAKAKADKIAQYLKAMPDKAIPELQFLDDNDWFTATKSAKFDSDADVRRTLRELRSIAKNNLPMGRSLYAFIQANNGQLPTDMSQLKPYFIPPVTNSSSFHWRGVQTPEDDALVDSILARYKLLHGGSVNDYPSGTWFIAEKSPVDKEYDTRMKSAPGTSTIISTGAGETGDPDDKAY
jgi:RNA polymerase sigma factor (sigma-70 family)